MPTLGFRGWRSLSALVLFISLSLTETVAAAPNTVDPTEGTPGTIVIVRGTNWPPGDLIKLAWNFDPQLTIISSVDVDRVEFLLQQ
jgi:hypothetical protein